MFMEQRISILEDYLNKLHKEGVFPGAVFSLIDSESCYINYLGKAQLVPEEILADENTIYDLASLTKVVATTTAIMMLIERGHFTLDTYVTDLLPDYENPAITIRHLLTHTSGHDADIDCSGMDKAQLTKAVYDSKIDPDRFNKRVLYSDIGYILLGFIIDRVTGSFEEFVTENLFKPLDMEETFFNPKDDYKERCAATEICAMRKKLIKGLVHDEKCYLLGGVSGHAGLFSTAKDLTNFVRMLLNKGEYNGKIILNSQTIDIMTRCYTDNMGAERGLGWIVMGENNRFCDLASEHSIYHTGFTGTSMLVDLKAKKGFILLTNRVHPSRENIKLIGIRRNINNVAFSAIR